MIFNKTSLKDAYLISLNKYEDERGFFTRLWCFDFFKNLGVDEMFVQMNLAYSHKRGTLRGLHYQEKPFEEAKLVRCSKGKIYDVIIDLRSESPTYMKWDGFYLDSSEYKMLLVPKGFAHGYKTIEDRTEVVYMVSQYYTPRAEKGIRWDDPVFDIKWPDGDPVIISNKDKGFEDFKI